MNGVRVADSRPCSKGSESVTLTPWPFAFAVEIPTPTSGESNAIPATQYSLLATRGCSSALEVPQPPIAPPAFHAFEPLADRIQRDQPGDPEGVNHRQREAGLREYLGRMVVEPEECTGRLSGCDVRSIRRPVGECPL